VSTAAGGGAMRRFLCAVLGDVIPTGPFPVGQRRRALHGSRDGQERSIARSSVGAAYHLAVRIAPVRGRAPVAEGSGRTGRAMPGRQDRP